jgi:hemolysin III
MDVQYSPQECAADTVVHVVGVTTCIAGAAWLMNAAIQHGAANVIAGLGLYALGLVLMPSMSAAYNLAVGVWKRRLRPWDHATIFIMIAGTYSPLCLVALPPAQGLMPFGIIWTVALAGACLKLCCPGRFERISIALYLALGWTFVALWEPLTAAMPHTGLVLLAVGAAIYTVGVGFHLAHRLRYHNAIWHAFVLAAAGCHFLAILDTALPSEVRTAGLFSP